jgi:hypothetical protein
MVSNWPSIAVTGNGELGFDSGEGALEMATTSKEGSRRANYPLLTYKEVVITNNTIGFCRFKMKSIQMFFLTLLEGKSGASSRGNSSSKSVY